MTAPKELLDFTGRVALVTGGDRGIGRGITERFLAAGADVAIAGETEPDDLPVVEGRAAFFVAADVRDADEVDALVTTVTERWGRLDVAVNSAGSAPDSDAADGSPRFSASIVSLDLLAAIHVAQRVNAVMQQQDGGGAIVNITSVSALRPSPGTAVHGAAAAGVIGLSQSLAVEWAPKVRINCVTTGLIRTEQSHLHDDENGIARMAATIPLGRLGEPTDVADACLYLASPLAGYVSGANLVLDGGGEWPAFLAAAEGTPT